MKARLARYFKTRSRQVERALAALLRRRAGQPETIRRAMRYSLFAGGKRLRPILAMASAECCGAAAGAVLKTAAALEMIHTYSLIHDDLPAMDDDDFRRGKPTNHKVFGEAIAVLAGDGLLTYAFEVIADNAAGRRLSSQSALDLVRVIAKSAGTQGMVAGQVADLEAENWRARNHGFKPAAALDYIHLHKTAALITASVEAGAILAKAGKAQRKALRAYGRAVGLAFQIADDILDVAGDKKKLGKRGSDRRNHKLTYASLYGLAAARQKARVLVARARRQLRGFGPKADMLRYLADYSIARDK